LSKIGIKIEPIVFLKLAFTHKLIAIGIRLSTKRHFSLRQISFVASNSLSIKGSTGYKKKHREANQELSQF